MGKNSKQRRDLKKKRRGRKNKSSFNSVSKDSSPVFQMMENPFGDMTDEQRRKMVRTLEAKSKEQVTGALDCIDKIFRKHDPIGLISVVAAYGLCVGASDDGIESNRSRSGIEQAHLEILQALALKVPEENVGFYPPTPEVIEEIIDKVKELSTAFTFSRMSEDGLNLSPEDGAINLIQEKLRGHTQMVRNWGFHSQVKTISRELYSGFDGMLTKELGFSVSNILDVFESLTITMESKLSNHFESIAKVRRSKKPKEIVIEYHKLIGKGEEEAEAFLKEFNVASLTEENAFSLCLAHYDLRIPDIYLIDFQELSKTVGLDEKVVRSIVDYFSLKIGDLHKQNELFFFLSNPAWNKPIIRSGDEFYSILPQLFFSFVFVVMDDIIEMFDKDGLHKRRATYLESKIEEIVKRRFPDSKVVSGVKWVKGESQFETDLIAFIDSHAIIIEAKSQKISKPALRGAPARIRRHLEEILIEPSVQSHRLELKINELKSGSGSIEDFVDDLPVDIYEINKVIRVSVSLEDFATLQSNLRLFDATGWVPDDFAPCPSMNLGDFEILFDLLEHPVQIVHYLLRRAEIENTYQFIGDELDFMGLYISNLFNLGNLTKDASTEIVLTGMSESLDLYYMSKDKGIPTPKPQPKITPWFKNVFNKLEERSTPRWSEIGSVLNRFPPDDQIKLSRHIKDLTKVVEKTWQVEGHKNSLIYNPAESSEYALAVVLFKNANRERRYEYVENALSLALEPKHVKHCLIIAINIDDESLPYHYIAFAEDAEV
ncbi:hypothetical protein [Salinivibrio sp. HTSP]|uniref:hypothetical protein n=1 Tax=Salinivibrio sp. HTSP TaxID=2115977 RepID=UPI000E310C99|nr:hypothetical protein [Salinivibrio sp. HTSP]